MSTQTIISSSSTTTRRKINPAITLVAPQSNHVSTLDHILVNFSSLFLVGSVVWVPALYIWLYKKWKNTPNDKEHEKKRKMYRNIMIGLFVIGIVGPHRHRKVGKCLNFRNWRTIKAWVKYVAFEIISEEASNINSESKPNFDLKKDQAVFAVVPHGIFPFSLGLAAWPQIALDTIGEFRPVVASATRLVPGLRTILEWLGSVDATKSSVERVLSKGERIGVCPGGIAEMFEGYPKPGRLPNDECALLTSRKGFVRLALKNNIPLIPVYCFGGNKMFKRLQLPKIVEKISNLVRISIVIFFGKYGLPIPFQQRLLWVVGNPIHPPVIDQDIDENSEEFRNLVDDLHSKFCDELIGIFERHKHRYGWGHKTLRLV